MATSSEITLRRWRVEVDLDAWFSEGEYSALHEKLLDHAYPRYLTGLRPGYQLGHDGRVKVSLQLGASVDAETAPGACALGLLAVAEEWGDTIASAIALQVRATK